MRVAVLGAGAVGSFLGAVLARSGAEVTLVGPAAHVDAIRRGGLRIEGTVSGTWALRAETALPAPLSVDAVLLTVKTFDLPRAAAELARGLDSLVPILLPQNGLGSERVVAEAFRRVRGASAERYLVRAVNTIPVTLLGPGLVRNPGRGEIRLADPAVAGESAEAGRWFFDAFQRAGIAVRWVPDLSSALWQKAVVNAAINPVTALHGIENGRLEEEPYRTEAEALLDEGRLAARAAGFDVPLAELQRALWATVRASALNRSSMLQDLDRGRPTEIQAISGALAEAARTHGFALERTERTIREVEARAGSGRVARRKAS